MQPAAASVGHLAYCDQPGTSAIMPLSNKDLGSAAREASQLRICLLTLEATQFSGWFKASIQ